VLTDSWQLGDLTVPNRVVLAPLAGIGNWFVRLQAKRYGAGLATSEMVSSFAIHYGNEKTRTELLRVDPAEGERGITSLQLFGQDPDVMRSAAAYVREHVPGVDVIDLNMGCPVPKVCKTGAGAAMLSDPDTAVAVARAAREGSGLPVTVKLRSGRKTGETDGVRLAHRLVDEAGVAAIGFHPRSAQVHHKGTPDYALAARLVRELDAPVVISGGLHDAASAQHAYEVTGATAIMLARGSLGNPWLFAQLLGERDDEPTPAEVLAELEWMMDRAVEHMGAVRGGRWMRKAYPWFVERMGGGKELQAAMQQAETIEAAREALHAGAGALAA
jgi:nifR3 family TIM-barrel protein